MTLLRCSVVQLLVVVLDRLVRSDALYDCWQQTNDEIDSAEAVRLENEQKMRDQMAFQRGGGVKLVDHPLYQAPQLKSSWMSMLPR
jgi:hypothetical protein